MDALTEKARPLAFILSEGNGYISREQVTIVSGAGKLEAGTVLGKITTGGKYQPSPATGSDGSQTAAGVLCYPVDATSADVPAVILTNDAEVKDPMLIFHSSVDDGTKRAAKITQLAAVKIKSR